MSRVQQYQAVSSQIQETGKEKAKRTREGVNKPTRRERERTGAKGENSRVFESQIHCTIQITFLQDPRSS